MKKSHVLNALCLIFCCTGCADDTELKLPTPDALAADAKIMCSKSLANKRKNPEKARYLSTAALEMGWERVKQYQMGKDKKLWLLIAAGDNFNVCWTFDPDNYQSYYGWAIVYGMRAEQECSNEETEFFLTNADRMFQMASEHNIPSCQETIFYLDWANLCNGIGSFYCHIDEQQKSSQYLNKAKSFLEKILKQSPDNGRAYFLLSVNCFYKKNFSQAKDLVRKASALGFDVPDNYMDDLTMHCK